MDRWKKGKCWHSCGLNCLLSSDDLLLKMETLDYLWASRYNLWRERLNPWDTVILWDPISPSWHKKEECRREGRGTQRNTFTVFAICPWIFFYFQLMFNSHKCNPLCCIMSLFTFQECGIVRGVLIHWCFSFSLCPSLCLSPSVFFHLLWLNLNPTDSLLTPLILVDPLLCLKKKSRTIWTHQCGPVTLLSFFPWTISHPVYWWRVRFVDLPPVSGFSSSQPKQHAWQNEEELSVFSLAGRMDTRQQQLFAPAWSMSRSPIRPPPSSIQRLSNTEPPCCLTFSSLSSSLGFPGPWTKSSCFPLKAVIDMDAALRTPARTRPRAVTPVICFLDEHIPKKEAVANLSVSDRGVSGMQQSIPEWSWPNKLLHFASVQMCLSRSFHERWTPPPPKHLFTSATTLASAVLGLCQSLVIFLLSCLHSSSLARYFSSSCLCVFPDRKCLSEISACADAHTAAWVSECDISVSLHSHLCPGFSATDQWRPAFSATITVDSVAMVFGFLMRMPVVYSDKQWAKQGRPC